MSRPFVLEVEQSAPCGLALTRCVRCKASFTTRALSLFPSFVLYKRHAFHLYNTCPHFDIRTQTFYIDSNLKARLRKLRPCWQCLSPQIRRNNNNFTLNTHRFLPFQLIGAHCVSCYQYSLSNLSSSTPQHQLW